MYPPKHKSNGPRRTHGDHTLPDMWPGDVHSTPCGCVYACGRDGTVTRTLCFAVEGVKPTLQVA